MRGLSFIAVPALLMALLLSGCGGKVEVEMGTVTLCPYGHTVSRDVKLVEVPAKEVSSYEVRTVSRVCERHAKLEALYAQAQAELAAGDYRAAKAILDKIGAEDPSFRQTQSQLDSLAGGGKPAPDTGSAPTTSTPTKPSNPGENDTSGPVGALLKYTPDSITGYKAGKTLTDALSITREYVPTGSSDTVLLVIVVEQHRSAAAARRALKMQVRDGYPQSSSEQRVGSHDTYFGTDGRRFAAVGFTDGAVFVALEMAAKNGVQPKTLKSALLQVAGMLP